MDIATFKNFPGVQQKLSVLFGAKDSSFTGKNSPKSPMTKSMNSNYYNDLASVTSPTKETSTPPTVSPVVAQSVVTRAVSKEYTPSTEDLEDELDEANAEIQKLRKDLKELNITMQMEEEKS